MNVFILLVTTDDPNVYSYELDLLERIMNKGPGEYEIAEIILPKGS